MKRIRGDPPKVMDDAGEQTGERGTTRRAVIVDDDEAIVETLEDVLMAEGYVVEGHTDPMRALERLCEGALPDVLVLDCVMPGMDGPALLEALNAAGRSMPVVLVTALSDPGFCVDPVGPHAARVINKPFDLDQLLETIDDVIAASRISG
jgi:DNA-binding NtrC family response regulator